MSYYRLGLTQRFLESVNFAEALALADLMPNITPEKILRWEYPDLFEGRIDVLDVDIKTGAMLVESDEDLYKAAADLPGVFTGVQELEALELYS